MSDLLLLNQFPDVEADKEAGRKHLLITGGKKVSAKIFAIFLVCPFVIIISGYLLGLFPFESLLGVIPLILIVPIIKGVLKNVEDNSRLIPYMGMNIVINIMTPLLLAIGFFVSRRQ